jgi:hypothetical protein
MFEDLFGAVTGRWGILAIALVAFPGGRKFIRSATKEIIRTGVIVTDKVKDLASEIKEEASDVIAEVRAEHGNGHRADHRGSKTSKIGSAS